MSAEQKPEKPVALENGRIPAKLSREVLQLCGRIPADSEGVMVNFGRIPNETPNALLAKPSGVAQPIAQVMNNPAGKPSVETPSQKIVSLITPKISH